MDAMIAYNIYWYYINMLCGLLVLYYVSIYCYIYDYTTYHMYWYHRFPYIIMTSWYDNY